MAAIAPETWSEARRACTRQISGHPYRPPSEMLAQLAASPEVDLEQDVYGEGGALANLERTVADLLGKETGVFVMKGMIAQLCALRVWTDRSHARTVALHPKSHKIDLDENGAFDACTGSTACASAANAPSAPPTSRASAGWCSPRRSRRRCFISARRLRPRPPGPLL